MKKIFLMMSLMAPLVVFAADPHTPKDIIPRALNFILFAAILYYFVATPVKNFFVGRANAIADELEKVQGKLRDSKKALQAAQQDVALARKQAEEIVSGAKKEAMLLKQKIEQSAEREIEMMLKQHNDAMEFERRRVEQGVIQEILQELFESEALNLDTAAYAEILLKKVA